MKQVIFSEETQSYKIIHDDFSETSVKLSPSGCFDSDMDSPVFTDKNKYSIIVSCSSGCPMKCKFCHLTKNNMKHTKLTHEQVLNNLKETLKLVGKDYDLSNKYLKLCWMGMGEAILDYDMINSVSKDIYVYARSNGYCIGLDGIDVSTTMPKIKTYWIDSLEDLNYYARASTNLNPANYADPDRTPVRVFYSLHNVDNFKRQEQIPMTYSINRALDILSENYLNTVIHYMFIDGVNSSKEDIKELIEFVNNRPDFLEYEFRVLRYNGFGTDDKEPDNFQQIIDQLKDELKVKKFKVQYSSGEDIKAACGQFITNT